MRKILYVTLIMVSILVGCTKDNTPRGEDNKKDVTSIQDENKTLQDQLNKLQA